MPPLTNETELVGHGHYITEMADIFMRAGGLTPVYIPYNISDPDLYDLLGQINGVYFTGGDLDLSDPTTGELHPYTITSLKIYRYALNATDNGDYFPLLGICQGLELLHILVANNTNALGWSLLENAHVSTSFTVADPAKESRLFSGFAPSLIHAMETRDLLWHFHHRSIPVFYYLKYPKLQEFFRILSVNEINGVYIATSVEAKKYPIYLTQYHPEVVLDPAGDINAVRSPINYKVAFGFANFFAEECAKSGHRFRDQETLEA